MTTRRIAAVMAVFSSVVFSADYSLASECSTSTISVCSNEEICFGLLIARSGTPSEREALDVSFPDNFIFVIEPSVGNTFAHYYNSISDSHGAFKVANMLNEKYRDGSHNSLRDEMLNIRASDNEMKIAAQAYYAELNNLTKDSDAVASITGEVQSDARLMEIFEKEAISRALICPLKSSVFQ